MKNRFKQFLKDTENRWLEIRMTRIVKKICKEPEKKEPKQIVYTFVRGKGTV